MPSRRTFLTTFTASALVTLCIRSARAGDPILTIESTTSPGAPVIALDLAALDRLPRTVVRTATPWTAGPHDFSGVLVADLFASLGLDPEAVRLVALNDYAVRSDVETLVSGGALLATRRDGEPMEITDKGPIFVVFPFDDRPELRTQNHHSRSVWQLARIEILP